MKRVLCVWFPNWPLQRLLAAQPELKDQPVVIYTSARKGQIQQVLTCSHQAAEHGVIAGISVAEAKGLLPVSSDSPAQQDTGKREVSGFSSSRDTAHFTEHDEQADLLAIEQVAIRCHRFSPRVGLGEPHGFELKANSKKGPKKKSKSREHLSSHSPETYSDTLLLDITGCEHLFGGEASLAQQVQRRFQQQQLKVVASIADTIGAAWAAAHYTDGKSNDVLQIVPPGSQATYLDKFPVAALRLESGTLEILAELNLLTIGQLLDLPRASLPSRLGSGLVHRLDQALGDVVEQITPVQYLPQAEAACTFAQPIHHEEALATVLLQLLEQLVDQLRPRQQGVQRLLIHLSGAQRADAQVLVGFVHPCDSPKYLAQMAQARLKLQRVPTEIFGVQVRAVVTASLVTNQVDLLGESNDLAAQKQFCQLIDRLNVRLGEQAVRAARLIPDAQPECAFDWQPLSSKSSADFNEPNLSTDFSLARPIWLKRQPCPIQVLAGLSDGRSYAISLESPHSSCRTQLGS